MPRIGRPAAHPVPALQEPPPRPLAVQRLAPPPATVGRSKAGTGSRPTLATSAHTSCTFLTSHPPLVRCCCARLGPCFRCPASLPLPLAPCRFSCRGQLDPLFDHRFACATSAVRALPLEPTLLRACVGRPARASPQHPARRHERRCVGSRCTVRMAYPSGMGPICPRVALDAARRGPPPCRCRVKDRADAIKSLGCYVWKVTQRA